MKHLYIVSLSFPNVTFPFPLLALTYKCSVQQGLLYRAFLSPTPVTFDEKETTVQVQLPHSYLPTDSMVLKNTFKYPANIS